MDKITESLKKYLESVGISHQTLFNSDCGLNNDYPTSTCFYLENEDSHWPRISFIVDIYPQNTDFYISAHPMWRCDEKDMVLLEPFKAKWNRCGMRTNLVFEEERGIIVPNAYCCHLGLFGICESGGLGENMWKRYFEIVVTDTYTAMMEIRKILGIDDMANESGYCGEESDGTPVVDDVPF